MEMENVPIKLDSDHIVIKLFSDEEDREDLVRYVYLEKDQLKLSLDDDSTIKYVCNNNVGIFDSKKSYATNFSLFSLVNISDVDILIDAKDMKNAVKNNNRYYIAVKIFVDIPSLISKNVIEKLQPHVPDEEQAMALSGGFHCQGRLKFKYIYKLFAVKY
jgi:hypothetical protein